MSDPYVAWDPHYMYQGIANIIKSIGNATNIGIWVLLILVGIGLAFAIAKGIGGN